MKKFLGILFIPLSIFSKAGDPQIVHGFASVEETCGRTIVRAEDSTVINWKEFSVQRDEVAQFILPTDQARILNRVTGSLKSEILGELISNGNFYFINPNGIVFGPDAQVNMQSAVFSTLDISDTDFLLGRELQFVEKKPTTMINEGALRAEEQIILLSHTIENSGTISAKKATLTASEEILLYLADDSITIRPIKGDGEIYQRGDIEALEVEIKGTMNPYSLAMNHKEETIEAVRKNGRVFLSHGTVRGRTIAIEGAQVEIGETVSLIADGMGSESGGSIYVIGKDLCFKGSATARGGDQGGDGGFIEISGSRIFDYHPQLVSTLAPKGKTGTLLLDPNDITIQSAMPTSGGFSNPYTGAGFQPALLLISDLIGAGGLLNNDVTVMTDAATGGGSGDITIADPFTWSSSHTLTLLPFRDLNVNALATSTGTGSIIANAGRTINVGTALATTPAGLIANAGSVTLTTVEDLILLGGSTLGSYAEISSISGTVSSSIGRDLLITGGSGIDAYASIGKGVVTNSTTISSDLIFTTVGRDVVLTGGSMGAGAYAQVGHAPNGPGSHTITSDITFPAAALGGSLALSGNGTNCTAIIGHGNELSPNIISASGSIQVFASEGVTLRGGASSNSHAVIGFQDVEGGNTTFNVTSNSINVQNVIMGAIELEGGTDSNAVIGYYNASILGTGPNLTITSLNVQVPITTNINLIGGDTSGMSNGVAAIGTLASLGTAQSGISLTTGSLNLNVTAPSGDGSARIINTLPTTTTSLNVTISCSGVGPVATLLGGTTSASNFAEIYSGNSLTFSFGGDLIVNNTTQNGFAQVRAANLISLNPNTFGGSIALAGSSSDPTGFALIQTINGPVQFGTQFNFGGTDVTLGDVTSVAPSRILSESGASIFNTAGGDFTLQGGTGASMPVAEIGNNQGTISISGKDMTLTGGSGMLAYAQIGSTLGDVTINLSEDLLLQGGSAVQAYAQIGKGNITTETSISSTLFFPTITGNVQILGGSAQGAYAQIGHSPINNLNSIDVTGDVNFSPTGINDFLTLMGGTALDATAIIGHGNELSTAVSSYTGNIVDLLVSNAILLQTDPGGTARTHAIIGFHSPTTAAASPFTLTSNSPGVFVKSVSNAITGNAGDGSNATIGYYNATNMGLVSGSIEQITVDANTTITFQAGNDGGTGAGVASIGTFVSSGSTLLSNILINGTTVSFLGPTGGLLGNDGSARCVNSFLDFASSTFPSASYDIIMNVTDLIVYGGTGAVTGFADIYSAEDLSVFFSNNLEINSSATLQNGYAHAIAYGDIDMGNIGNLISVIGGAVFTADARIQSINGNSSHGSFQGGGALTINIGQANSLSTSQVITSIGTNNINSTGNFTIQGGAGLNTVSLVRTDSGDFSVSSGQDMTITGGTGGNFASAEIRSLSGFGQVAVSNDLTMLGGGNTLCFAQINSDTGPITFSEIGNNLTLTGGPADECYAQIGKGFVDTATFINSTLTFSSIGNNVTLNGSSMGADSYAQIGHSPFYSMAKPPVPAPINVEGDIRMQGIGGKLTLNGGPGPAANTTAIIGHGNEVTPYIRNCNGSISINNSGLMGIELNPGAPLLNTHAVIGFHSPAIHPMNMVTFRVQSPTVQVSTISGPIAINGGDRSNAIIGYYNQTTPALMPPGVDVTIDTISVNCSLTPLPANNITLLAGNDMGTNDGVAIIGTSVATGNSAISNIDMMGNSINVLGPTGTDDGYALITNNRLAEVLASRNVSFTNTNTITVFGGTGAATGLAEIYSSGQMVLDFMTGLNVGFNSALPATLATADQLIRSFGDMTMNMNGSKGSILMIGGATALIQTDISTLAGKLLIGNTNQIQGAKDITIGSASMSGPARMFTVTGDLFAETSGNTTLTGGVDAAAIANIEANTNLTLNAAGTVSLLGGSAVGAVARISASSGNNMVYGGSGVILTGSLALAEIRQFGFDDSPILVQSGDSVTMNANSRILNDANGATKLVALNNLTMNGDAYIQNIGSGLLSTFSGVSSFFNGTSRVQAGGGDIAIVVDNDFPTPPGIGPGRFVTEAGVEILSPGKVRIFTAKRPQNSVESLLNGNVYVPGIEYVDTPTEKWRIYYFSSLGGVPFTLFYKDFIPVGPVEPLIIINAIGQVQYLQNLRMYDFPVVDFYSMSATFEYRKNNPIALFLEETYWYRFYRQFNLNYDTKSLDPFSSYW